MARYGRTMGYGYEPWGVTNPWVFANYRQPQRQRGSVSPVIYKTHQPWLTHPNLGGLGATMLTETAITEEAARAVRMERIAIAGLAIGLASLATSWFYLRQLRKNRLNTNRRRHRRRSR